MAINIDGDGLIALGGTASTQGRLRLAEDTDNGTNFIELTAPASVGSDRVITFPDVTGTVLTNATTTGFPAGSVLQVVQTVKTDAFTTTSLSPVDITGLSVNITPTSASNKILIVTNVNYGGEDNLYASFFVLRDSTNVVISTAGTGLQTNATFGGGPPRDNFKLISASHTHLDSPNTTSAITYKVQVCSKFGSISLRINLPSTTSNDVFSIGGTSSITVMEIAA